MFGHYMFNYVPIHAWGGKNSNSKQGPSGAKVEESPWEMTAGELWQSDSGETQTIAAWESGYVLTPNNDGTMTAELKFSGGIPPLTLRRVQVMGAESDTPHEHDVRENLSVCYGVNPPCTDAERELWAEKWEKIVDLQTMLFEIGGYTGVRDEDGADTKWFPNNSLKWCVCGDKFHFEWMDEGGTHGTTTDDTLQTRSAYINPATEEEVKFELRKSQNYGDHWTPWNYSSYRVDCSYMATKVDCDETESSGSGASGQSNSSSAKDEDGDDQEPEEFTMSKYALPIVAAIVIVAAGYLEKKEGYISKFIQRI